MRFVSFHVQTQSAHPHLRIQHAEYLRLIEYMVRSVRRFHPQASLTLLTDAQTDLSDLHVDIERENHEVDPRRLMLSRAEAQWRHLQHRGLQEPVLFLDSDMLVNENLSSLFDDPGFDVALTVRQDADMPVNGGFMLLNHRRPHRAMLFFERYLQCFRARYADEAAWFGDQHALRDAAGLGDASVPSAAMPQVKLLACERYNHTPGDRLRKALKPRPGCAILHFKGRRKRLMPLYWHAHLSGLPKPLGILAWSLVTAWRWLRAFPAQAAMSVSAERRPAPG